MALLFVDGFDAYSSTSGDDYLTRWTGIDNSSNLIQWDSTGGRFGGGALVLRDNFTDSLTVLFMHPATATATTTICVGFWFKTDGGYTELSQNFGEFSYPTAGSAVGKLIINGGKLGIREAGGTTIYTGATNICDNQWHWVEVRTTWVTGTGGSAEIWVDGLQDAVYSGVDMLDAGTGAFSQWIFRTTNGQAADIYIDDLVIYDDSSGPLSGDITASSDFPIGPLKIETQSPTSTGSNANFTPSTTDANYLLVDDAVSDGDATYVESETVGDVDTHNFASLSSTGVQSIIGVVANITARYNGLNATYTQAVAVSSGSTANSNSYQMTGGYLSYQHMFGYDPATSTRWTTAGLDAAEFGYAVSSST